MRNRINKTIRIPRKLILVICEGETEKSYVELLKRHYRLPVTIKTKVSGNQINNRLVKEYLNEAGVGHGDDYKIFYVYDSDIDIIVNRLRKLEGNLILTNPCMELWFLLHMEHRQRESSSDEVLRRLRQTHAAWQSYIKGCLTTAQSDVLLANTDIAVERAKTLNWPDNPSSNIFAFIETLEEAKNR